MNENLVKELSLINNNPKRHVPMMIHHHNERYALSEMFMIHVTLPK